MFVTKRSLEEHLLAISKELDYRARLVRDSINNLRDSVDGWSLFKARISMALDKYEECYECGVLVSKSRATIVPMLSKDVKYNRRMFETLKTIELRHQNKTEVVYYCQHCKPVDKNKKINTN